MATKKAQKFQIVKGFNITLADGSEKRYEAGKATPVLVEESNFNKSDWEALLEMEAIVAVKQEK